MGLSVSHLIIIFLILLLLFGAQRLEGIGTSLGKAVRGFKDGLEGKGEDPSKEATKTAVNVKDVPPSAGPNDPSQT